MFYGNVFEVTEVNHENDWNVRSATLCLNA